MGKRSVIWHVMVGMTSDHVCCERGANIEFENIFDDE
ncbi:hypothetical protein AZ002_003592 [Citrobacter freundii]|nr:hypothetical protein AZ003_000903 [Citrobacter freundii]OUE61380.1 hypothetical protein AZ002_003592 [Citrobacter freundii]CAE7295809.1 hypothetical protein AI2609V1_2734 [Citrobacter freundii]CAH3653176.1 hypothetical protein AI2609V1_2734 [Citrobacter freundii]